ncbi:MAG TPA: nucleotidyltransferase [Bacteroides sp.]|nr:nucleotidyltransferase [Bacteroides sp.]
MKPTLLILAAGMGSRYGSLKQIDAVGPSGEAIIDYSIYDAIRAGFEKVTFIIRRSIENEFREVFGDKLKGRIETDFVFQELDMVPEGISYSPDRVKPWGTAHAIWVAKSFIRQPFVAINADDFYGAGSYQAMADYLSAHNGSENEKYCMMGYQIQHTLSDFGSVSRGICDSADNDFLKSVVERTEIVRDGEKIHFLDENGEKVELKGDDLVSMNIWGFTPAVFEHIESAFSEFIEINASNKKAELYIPAVVNDLVSRNTASVEILPALDQWFGVTYKEDKPLAVEYIKRLIEKGVYPDNLWG